MHEKKGGGARNVEEGGPAKRDTDGGAVVEEKKGGEEKGGGSPRKRKRGRHEGEAKKAGGRGKGAGKVWEDEIDPHEVWKGYNTSKNYAAFVTKTLVNKDGDIQRRIMAMFSN
ncbi:hypothetical protein [Shigella flexneri]|uniref:hypothetical protein n=1 Tax=Shigella flexneri TaxID=623 RepID=UPI002096703B